MILILLLIALLLLLTYSIFASYVLLKSLRMNRTYEEFYNVTLDDVDAVIESLEELMYRRQLLSDDPDVRKVYKDISLLRDILAQYTDVLNSEAIRTRETKEAENKQQ